MIENLNFKINKRKNKLNVQFAKFNYYYYVSYNINFQNFKNKIRDEINLYVA